MSERDRRAEDAVGRLADHLDRAARPVDPAAARSMSAAVRRPARRPRVVVGAVAAALAVVGAGLLVVDRGEDRQPVVAGPATTVTTAVGAATIGSGGLAVSEVNADGVALVDDAGDVVANVPFADDVQYASPPAFVLVGEDRMRAVDADPADVPEGCSRAVLAGTTRVALCGGGDPQLPDAIDLVDHLGARRTVASAPPGHVAGHWRSVVASPDGGHVLAQWSGECEVPSAWILDVATGGLHQAFGEGLHESIALGWDDDGRALVQALEGICGEAGPAPGVYALAPDVDAEPELRLATEERARAFAWRAGPADAPPAEQSALTRASAALGWEAAPATDGAEGTWAVGPPGDEVAVTMSAVTGVFPYVPFNDHVITAEPATIAGGPGTVGDQNAGRFAAVTCGRRVWTATHPDSDLALARLAALVPRLGCALGEAPLATGHEDLGPEAEAAADDLAARLLALALDPGAASLADIPFAGTVMLGLGDREPVAVDRADLVDPATWMLETDGYAAREGPVSALELLASAPGPLDATLRPAGCAQLGFPIDETPDALDGYDDVFIQPTAIDTCLDWFAVTVYSHPLSGEVAGVVVSLWAP